MVISRYSLFWKNAVVNIVSMRSYVFCSHGLILGSRIAIECGNSVFNVLRNFQAVW